MEGCIVAVVEGGEIYFTRTDHIRRPVFATNGLGVKVWEASYLPFGGVHVATGGIACAFRVNGCRPKAACTRTGCATTIPQRGGISGPTRWGWWMGHPSTATRSRTRGGTSIRGVSRVLTD